jgi:hypothetical protein
MTKSPLRAVDPEERAPKPLTIAQAVAQGDYLEILKAQQREIAESLPEERGPAKAALHRQLSIVSKEIESLEARDRDEGATSVPVESEPFDEAAI